MRFLRPGGKSGRELDLAQILAWRPLGASKINRIKAPQTSCQSREDREPRNTRNTRKALSLPRIPRAPRFLKELLGEDLGLVPAFDSSHVNRLVVGMVNNSVPLLHKPKSRTRTSSLKLVIEDGWSRSELIPRFRRRLREIRLFGHPAANLGQTEFNGLTQGVRHRKMSVRRVLPES